MNIANVETIVNPNKTKVNPRTIHGDQDRVTGSTSLLPDIAVEDKRLRTVCDDNG
jgi:hypothetical protein